MSAMPLRLDSLVFNSGDVIDVSDDDIIVLVGPNNTGKSRTLQELLIYMAVSPGMPWPEAQMTVLQKPIISKKTDVEGIRAWLEQNRYTYLDKNNSQLTMRADNIDLVLNSIDYFWSSEALGGQLASTLIKHLSPGDRLSYVGSAQRWDSSDHPTHPLQKVVTDPPRLRYLSEAYRAAFKQNLIIDAWGSSIRMRTSEERAQDDYSVTSVTGLPDLEMMARMAQLPPIEEQSDGVRSFTGVLLTLLAGAYPVLMVDEPEAFLHPPQARLLGRYLSAMRQDGQLIVATHSTDILLGLLENQSDRVKVARLTRSAGKTSAQTVSAKDIRQMWSDPLMRFSRAFDGLFHDGVVVCEGDTDSLFYSAVAAYLDGVEPAASAPDVSLGAAPISPAGIVPVVGSSSVMFLHAGDKRRVGTMAKALRAVKVPTRVIVDFDILNDEANLKRLVLSMGASYSEQMHELWEKINADIRGSDRKLDGQTLSARLIELAGKVPVGEVSTSFKADVRASVANPSGWERAKERGLTGLPRGDSVGRAQLLLEILAGVGLHVVPVGIIESFVPQVGGHGPRWALQVIDGGLIAQAASAHVFLAEVLSALRADVGP